MKTSFLLTTIIGLFLLLPSASLADSCLTADCHASIREISRPHQPAADGDCLFCHVQTADEHPAKEGKSFELVEKGADLCYQCHDAMGKKKVVHYPVEEGDCLFCHQPHGSDNSYLLDVGADLSDLCFQCHDEDAFKRQTVHGPVAAGACTMCHSPHESSHQALLRRSIRETCLGCHDDFARQIATSPVVHPPVKDGPCTDCHDPHSSDASFVLRKKMPDLCFDCHVEVGETLADAANIHQPLKESGSCGNCHSTHFSQSRGLLPTDEKDLCLGCHGVDDLGDPPLKNIRKQIEGKEHLHGPVEEGECVPCHDPHGSNNFRLLTGPYPEGLYFPYRKGAYDFCLQCHDENMLRYEETSLYTNFRDGRRNLHYVHVANGRKGRTCRLCHEPHASNGEKLISKGGFPFGDWKIPIRFKKTETGGSCAPGCHRPLEYDREAR